MSQDILATFSRDHINIYTDIPVQVDFSGDMEITVGYSEQPHYRHDCFIQQVLDIRAHDTMTDQLNTDPRTSTAVTYIVVDKPEKFPVMGYMTFKADDPQTSGL